MTVIKNSDLASAYFLINVESGTALDLSGQDGRSIIGYPLYGSLNQQWELTSSGAGYVIRSIASRERYLFVRGIRDEEQIIAMPFPVAWNVYRMPREDECECIRIAWAGTEFVMDLADSGRGTKVQLMNRNNTQRQLWKLIPSVPPMPWGDGTYFLINVVNGMAIELSGENGTDVVGSPFRGGALQTWVLKASGSGYMISSNAETRTSQYIMIEDDTRKFAAVVATPFPASWNVQVDGRERTLRISWPETNYTLQLADGQRSEKGTKIRLMQDVGQPSQLWRFIRCV